MLPMNLEEFLDCSYSLGLKINRDVLSERKFIDLESFFLYSTIHISSSIRVARYVEYWVYAFGKYLSVKRIGDHIKKNHPYRPEFLYGLLKIIDDSFDHTGPMKVLSKYLKTNNLPFLLPIVSDYDFKKIDSRWESVGIKAPVFIPDEIQKTIRDIKWITKYCPELYYRIQGLGPILSDMKAYFFFNKKVSLYRMAIDLNLTYSCVHQNYKKYIEPFRT